MEGKCITQKGEGEIYTESSNSCVVYIREKKFFNGCINVQAAFSLFLRCLCAPSQRSIYVIGGLIDKSNMESCYLVT